MNTHCDLCIVDLEDCSLVVNTAAAAAAAPTPPPLFIVFAQKKNGGVEPRWASKEESDSIHVKLDAVYRALQKASTDRGVVEPSPPNSPATNVHIIKLGDAAGNLTLPTINGCLLGYPVVYVVDDQEHGEAVSRCLSSTTLRVHSISACLATTNCSKKIEESNKTREGGVIHPLISFSLPVGLEANAGEWKVQKKAWIAGLREQHAAAVALGVPFKSLEFNEISEMRGIAL